MVAAWLVYRWRTLWVAVALHICMNLWWELFSVSKNAVGGWFPFVLQTLAILLAILGTPYFTRPDIGGFLNPFQSVVLGKFECIGQPTYYIGLDVHKQKISYCVKDSSGKVFAEGWIPATRFDLDRWMKTLPQPWSARWKPRCSPAGSTIT